MPNNWSKEEVKLTVEDYFSMLNEELSGNKYNKTNHRKELIKRLNNRTEGSIERKHQNISAVLSKHNYPFIQGYKPLKNFQHDLEEAVLDYLESHPLIPQNKCWAVLANPNVYDIEQSLEDLDEDTWVDINNKSEVGDGIVFWRSINKTDGNRGIVGLGKVISPSKMMKVPNDTLKYFITKPTEAEEPRIWIKTHKLPNPIWIDDDKSGVLKGLSVSNAQGNKLYKISAKQWKDILSLSGGWRGYDTKVFPIHSYSWNILSPNIFLKEIDKSVFRDGTGIPIDVRKYFDIEDMSSGEQRATKLILKNKTYDAQIVMDRQPNPRTQLRWKSDFASLLQEEFPEWYEAITNDADITSELPEIRFIKTDKYTYSIEFIHPSEIDLDIDSEIDEEQEPQKEGATKYYYGKRYERNPQNRKKAIEIHGCICLVCGFDFEKFYGQRGKGYIEIHHTKPLSSNGEEILVNHHFFCPPEGV